MTVPGSLDSILGLNLQEQGQQPRQIPEKVLSLAAQRDAARQHGDWAEADRLRDAITALGYTVQDTSDGTKLI